MGERRIDGTAIVTGAGKRVGAHIARGLLEDGWAVIAHVHDDGDAVPEGAVKVVADLAEIAAADFIFAAAVTLPPVRLLVNNAARFVFDSLGAFSTTEFDAHMAINVRAPLLLMQRMAAMHRGGEALIVNILDSKLAALNPDYFSYTLSKQALAGATELAGRALAQQSIRVNSVAPALMLQSPGQTEANFAAMHSANPLSRGVEPADVLAAINYLVEARAMTGQCLLIDGGQGFVRLDRDVQFWGLMNLKPLDGLVPDTIRVRTSKIMLQDLAVEVDIGFHEFEIGAPQRLLVSVEIWLDDLAPPPEDDPAGAWDYDYLRSEIRALAAERRYNLQETLAHRIFDRFAALHGVKALRVATAKPDIYPDARGVGVEIASF